MVNRIEAELPPVIQIAADERLWRFDTPDELSRFLRKRGLLAELKRQASWSVGEFQYANRAKDYEGGDGLIVTATPSLDPFQDGGKCSDLSCRTELARDFLQSAAMFADITLVTDSFTSIFCSDGKWASRRFEELFARVKLLDMALPLMRAGLIRFGSPTRRYCEACYERAMQALQAAVQDLLAAAEKDIAGEYYGSEKKGLVAIRTAVLNSQSDHPLHHLVVLSGQRHIDYLRACGRQSHSRRGRESRRFLAQLIRSDVESLVRQSMFDVALAKETHSLLLAAGRVEPLLLSSLDGGVPPLERLAEWEDLRTLKLPWLSDLTPEECLQVRYEASIALPRLRELILRRIASGNAATDGQNFLYELRDQALQVEDELAQLPLATEKRFRIGAGTLAMLLVVYGLGTGRPELMTASMATLLAALAHLRSTEREHEKVLNGLVRQPGYALLKGKQVIERRKATSQHRKRGASRQSSEGP